MDIINLSCFILLNEPPKLNQLLFLNIDTTCCMLKLFSCKPVTMTFPYCKLQEITVVQQVWRRKTQLRFIQAFSTEKVSSIGLKSGE